MTILERNATPAPVSAPLDPALDLLLRSLEYERRALTQRLTYLQEVQAQVKVGVYPSLMKVIENEYRALQQRYKWLETVVGEKPSAARRVPPES